MGMWNFHTYLAEDAVMTSPNKNPATKSPMGLPGRQYLTGVSALIAGRIKHIYDADSQTRLSD